MSGYASDADPAAHQHGVGVSTGEGQGPATAATLNRWSSSATGAVKV